MSKRIQDLVSPTAKLRRSVRRRLLGPLSYLSENQKFWLGFGILSLLTSLLIFNPLWRSSGEQTYREGDIAREGIVSPADIQFTDAEETDRIRQMSRETVRPIFTFESRRAEEAVQNFRSTWESLLRKAENTNSSAAFQFERQIRDPMDRCRRYGCDQSIFITKIQLE